MKRRGSLMWMYEFVQSLIFIGLFIVVVFTYISSHADGSAFFSQFYAIDLATTAQTVNAGYGDVLLRYDNLKPTLNLRFWLENGVVIVAKPTQTYTEGLSSKNVLDSVTTTERYYGFAKKYPIEKVLDAPRYIALRKFEDSFTILDSNEPLVACPIVTTEFLPLEEVSIKLEIEGSLTDAEKDVIRNAFTDVVGNKVADDGTIILQLTKETGDRTTVNTGATSEHGVRFACLFKHHLTQLTNLPLTTDLPTPTGSGFTVPLTITVGNLDTVRNEQIGQALGIALATYYD